MYPLPRSDDAPWPAPSKRSTGIVQVILLVFAVLLGITSQCKTEEMASAPVASQKAVGGVSKSGKIIRTPIAVVSQEPTVLAQTDVRSESLAPVVEKAATYTVRKGDVLSWVFPKNWRQVCETNNLKDCDKIVVGQKLKLPQGSVVVSAGGSKKTVHGAAKRSRDADGYRPIAKLNVSPYGKYRTEAKDIWKVLGPRGYSASEIYEYLKLRDAGKCASELFSKGTKFPWMSFGNAKVIEKLQAAWDEPEVGLLCQLSTGRNVVIMQKCGNLTEVEPRALPKAIPEAKQSVVPALPGKVSLPISAFPKKDIAEWEVIVGAGVWNNDLAHGQWHYGEAAVTAVLPDGYRLGGGVYGMWGRGESERSDYRWREHGYGPQLVLKRNFLREQTDEFGQAALMPAMWGLKLRYLPNDHVKGHDPVSGYAQTQDGRKLGLYAEYIERTSIDWLLGVNAEVWRSYDRRISSTWSGDKPQDRGSFSANVFAQYRVNDEWQVRGILGASHQNWDKLNFGSAALEGRYRETVMFGPRVSVALNKPDAYKNVSQGDLTTLGAFVRLELGDTFRVWDREARENSVRYVGPASSTPTQ